MVEQSVDIFAAFPARPDGVEIWFATTILKKKLHERLEWAEQEKCGAIAPATTKDTDIQQLKANSFPLAISKTIRSTGVDAAPRDKRLCGQKS